ncbi:SDR family oxidoreductase [Dyadobacter jiangsuensis]|uniref:NADP-dependent 3-hydroxy acid dehydrogenase YdfG n=1 Tax=Dyadobacter jiangsuensis TaxID=1591085 RepID=A0A2P8FA33_9BACT|nr:SDR family oxidoreductase [Dyadobacter jiangsuensis]PSL18579.1 NADP-dependent 3-hydroxy acid dehydrogenase YdfG [Dyadobacter jiangsuensis]
METQSKIALITGASSGIGAGTAKVLAANGFKVGIAARRIDKLNELKNEITLSGGEALPIQMDVTDPDSVKRGVEKLVAAYGSIDVLVNNAGLMPLSDIESLKVDEWNQMIDVNIKGVLNSTAAVLPYLKEQNSGHIINMSSIAGRKVFKGLSIYCATKFAIAAFSDGLRMELAPKFKIRVTNIQPGAVATELYDHISDPKYRDDMEQLAKQMTFLTGEDIGNSILYAVSQPAHVNVSEVFVLPTEQGW